jgi:hypothetical protein
MVINDKIEENTASLKICVPISFSVSGPSVNINLNSVDGALFSLEAISRKSFVSMVGRDFTSLCSTILLTLARKRNEFMTAGKRAITPMISDRPAIAKAPYSVPSNSVPESPGNILVGNL